MIYAFGHKSRVGKDTACEFLKTYFRTNNITVTKTSFAYALKQACNIMFAWAGVQTPEYYENHPDTRNIILTALGMTVVDLWIKIGTPIGREQLHKDMWVNAAFHKGIDTDVTLISDMRFPNEFDAVKQRGGKCIRIDNPRAPVRDSVADRGLDGVHDWDFIITNDGNFKSLNEQLMRVINAG